MASYAELRKKYAEGPSVDEKFRQQYAGPITSQPASEQQEQTASEQKKSPALEKTDSAITEAISKFLPKATTAAAPKRDAAAYEQAKQATKEKKAVEGYAEAQKVAAEDKAVYDAGVAEIDALSDEDRRNLEKYVADRSRTQIANMFVGPQFDSYNLNPIVQKYGIDDVRRMAEIYERQQNEAAAKQVEQDSRDAVTGKVGNAVGQSALSVGANMIGSATGVLGRVQEISNRTGQFSTLQQHTVGDLPSLYASTVREEISQNISGDEYDEEGNQTAEGGKLRQGLSYGYQGIMSLADSIARSLTLGTSGGAALAAAGSFSQAVSDASKNGATPAEAVVLGVATAGMEYLTEKIPMDEVFKVAKSGNVNVLGQMFKQAGVEISTEELSLFGTMAAEAAIMQEKSAYKQQIGEAIAHGMTYDEAKAQADKAVWEQVKQTAAVSGISGAASGGGSAIVGNVFGGDTQTPTQETHTTEAAVAPDTQTQTEQPTQAQPQQDVAQAVAQELTQAQQAEADAKAAQEQTQQAIAQGMAEEYGPMMPQAEPKSQMQQDIDNATAAALEGLNGQKNTAPENGAVTVKSAGTALTEENEAKNTLAYELATKLDSIRDMEPVSQLTGREFQKTDDGKKISDKLREFFKAIGNKVSRNGFGDVEIGEYGIGAFLTHKPINRARAVSMAAVPDVIRNGRQIGYDPNWKGRGYPSYIFAAPVKVAGTDLYVAAVVNQLPDNKFYLSEMVDSNGNYVRIEESPSGNSKNGLPMGPENQQGRSYAGPEELPKGNDPTANAEPTSLSDNIIRNETSEVKGTGAAEQNFSGKAQYQDLLYEGNVQPDREGDVRPMEVPKTDPYGRNVSEFVANAYGAEVTPDEMASTIEELVQEGALGFDRRSNQSALNDAAKEIEKRSPSAVTKRITSNIARGKLQDGDIEQAMLLYSHYANKNGERAQAQAAELMVDLTTMAHMTGRNLQLFKLLRKLTPEGQVMTVKRTVEQNVESMIRSGKADKDSKVEINEQLLEEYKKAAAENARAVSPEQKAESEAKMQELQQAIMTDAASQIKSTFKAKWDAWRYMAMLGNGKTQIRNFAGNALFMPYKAAKDTIGAAFEKAIPKDKRTKSLTTDFELLNWARQDSKTGAVSDALKYTGKLGDDATNAKFADQVKVFDNKALEATRKAVEGLPQNADLAFKNAYYAQSLAGFLRARGYKLSDIQSGNVSDAIMTEARGYAINEAMKATFNDCNAFSDAVSNIGRKETDNAWSKAFNYAAESVLPFRRTPANVVVRFAEYSPAGMLKGAWDMADKVATGKLSAASAIDQVASGVTGTGALMLGYLLAKGIGGVKLTGSGADEDEKRQGHQDYALEFSINGKEYSYKIDWAAPANLPLFVGANLYSAMESNGEDTDISTLSKIWQVSKGAFEPMLQLSCMSSLNDLFETARYAPEGEALYSVAADIATGYFTQGIPALARQAAQAKQVNKQTTFANDADPTVRELQKLGAQIPFAGEQFQTDKRNAWGETETTEDPVMRAFNAFINPGTLKQIDNSELEKEISRLNEAQEHDVTPPEIPKKLNYTDTQGNVHDGYRLTEDQYKKIAVTQGQTAKKVLSAMTNSKEYKNLTDVQKAYAINAAYEYAQEKGKQAALPDYYSKASAWIAETRESDTAAFVARGAKKAMDDAIGNAVERYANNWTVSDAAKADMDATYKAFSKMYPKTQEKILDEASTETVRYIEGRKGGATTQNYLDATGKVKKLGTDAKDREKYAAIAKMPNVSESAKDALIKAYMPNYNPDSSSPNLTELKYDYIRQDMEKAPNQYADIMEIYNDVKNIDSEELEAKNQKRKDVYIAEWVKIGMSEENATELYNLLVTNGKQKIDVVGWHNNK